LTKPVTQVCDPYLSAVVAAWPNLLEPIRRAIMALLDSGG